MLDKLGGAFAPKPSSGPHKSRECLPLSLILRNWLKYALTYREVIAILMQRHILVDGKVRTDKTYPAGFMDVVSIPKTNENFRLLYDTKGRFRLHSIRDEEAKFKLCKVRNVQFGKKGIPYINTYDGRTIRYPDPLIKANDTIKLDLETNKIVDFIKFDVGNVVMVTGGRSRREASRLSTSRMLLGTSLLPVWEMSTQLERVPSRGYLFRRVRELSCLSLRRLRRGLLLNLLQLRKVCELGFRAITLNYFCRVFVSNCMCFN
ncbi:40S ribosomal protein s4-3 [Phtheirospermum japonicum]|uniref:40S ribosomal protein s4-3 n=1 Tax=Phtheirospermum japonicum TaxID=374723 RepID=A0A830C6Q1_9LAMI|nr:40S ribosomal protein s4-3 [Phtheirospermum japonicum]